MVKHDTNICETFQQLYQQVMDSSDSHEPGPIARAFLMAHSRLEMKLAHEERENILGNKLLLILSTLNFSM
jgi:hypothetical protein